MHVEFPQTHGLGRLDISRIIAAPIDKMRIRGIILGSLGIRVLEFPERGLTPERTVTAASSASFRHHLPGRPGIVHPMQIVPAVCPGSVAAPRTRELCGQRLGDAAERILVAGGTACGAGARRLRLLQLLVLMLMMMVVKVEVPV